MKKAIALCLSTVLFFCLMTACDHQPVKDDAAPMPETVTPATVTLTVVTQDTLPEISSFDVPEGYAFRGFYTEPEGEGSRILDGDYVAGSTVYAFCTKTVDPYDVRFIAFSPYSYRHAKEEDENGNQYEIGYRGTEEDFYFMKEFGFDLISLDVYDSPTYPAAWKRDCRQNISWATQYDFEYMVSHAGASFENMTPDEIHAIADFYAQNPLFFGYGIADEPGFGELAHLRRIVDAIVAAYPDSENHINYISYGLMNSRQGLRDYYQYAYTYIKNHHMATDPYPYDSERPGYVGFNYYNELATIAECARDGGKQLWLYTQTMSTAENPYDYMRFNCLADAAYGCTGFVQFCYALTHNMGIVQDGLVPAVLFDNLGNRSVAWYEYRDAITDMRPMLEKMAEYRWQYGGVVMGDDTSHNYEAIHSTNEFFAPNISSRTEAEKYASFVKNIRSNYGLVACAFEDVNGSGAGLFLLNSTEMLADLSCDVTLDVPDAVSATMVYNDTELPVERGEDGMFRVFVPSADGVFVTFEFDK